MSSAKFEMQVQIIRLYLNEELSRLLPLNKASHWILASPSVVFPVSYLISLPVSQSDARTHSTCE